jgi:hypothetical protein
MIIIIIIIYCNWVDARWQWLYTIYCRISLLSLKQASLVSHFIVSFIRHLNIYDGQLVHQLRSCDSHEFQNHITKLCESRSNGLKAEFEEHTNGRTDTR